MAGEMHAPHPEPKEGSQPTSPGGYARVAQRISRLTVNLIASAVVLLVMLLVGAQLTDYWRSATAPNNQASGGRKSPVISDPRPGQDASFIDVGDGQSSIVHANVSGDRQAAVAALRRVCTQATLDTPASNSPFNSPPPPGEAALLQLLATASAAAKLSDGVELFELPGAIPMAIVTKIGVVSSDPHSSVPNVEKPAPPSDSKVAGPQRRVLTWGIAIRSAERGWSVYAIHPKAKSAVLGQPTAAAERWDVPIPAGAKRILRIRRGGEPAVSAFYGPKGANTQQWRHDFDQWATGAGIRVDSGWTIVGDDYSARFSRQISDLREQIDIQFGPDGQGGLRGMITQSTGAAAGG